MESFKPFLKSAIAFAFASSFSTNVLLDSSADFCLSDSAFLTCSAYIFKDPWELFWVSLSTLIIINLRSSALLLIPTTFLIWSLFRSFSFPEPRELSISAILLLHMRIWLSWSFLTHFNIQTAPAILKITHVHSLNLIKYLCVMTFQECANVLIASESLSLTIYKHSTPDFLRSLFSHDIFRPTIDSALTWF